MSEGTEFGLEDAFYIVKYSEGYSFFVSMYAAAVDIHDERYDDDDAVLLKFYLEKDNQFKVDQISWKAIVKAYQEGDQKKEK